jgi:hypothetical protein
MGGRGLLVVGAAVLVLGCGSSSNGGVKTGPETSSQKGVGGQGGAGVADAAANETGAGGSGSDLGGAAGAPGGTSGFTGFPDGEVPSCSVLETQYSDTIAGAQSCDINGTSQCQQLVDAMLSACPTCQTYVNDAAIVNSIKANWIQIGCASTATSSCPPVSCPQQKGGACVASSSGGTCATN